MLKVPQKAPKFVGFNPDALDLTQVRPLVEAGCKLVEPAVESFMNYDKLIFDKLPQVVDDLIRAEQNGEGQDAVFERHNADAPAMTLKGASVDWRKVVGDFLPYLVSLLGDLLKPRAKAVKGKTKRK